MWFQSEVAVELKFDYFCLKKSKNAVRVDASQSV